MLTGAEYLKERDALAQNDLPAEIDEDSLIVEGSGFNEWSRIMLDNKPKDTVYLDDRTLMLDAAVPRDYVMISVGQFDENLKPVGKCVNLVHYPQYGRPAR